MTYEEWLNRLDLLLNKNDNNILKELQNTPYNPNIESLLTPKISELIDNKLVKAIKGIVNEVEMMYNDQNYLDLCMLEFKKNVLFIEKLIKIPQLQPDKQEALTIKLKDEVEKTYDILENNATALDDVGILQMVIKNNRIKWE